MSAEPRQDGPPCCAVCGEPAPYGDARIPWLGYHQSATHRIFYTLRAHRRYLGYVVRHKWFVFRAGLKVGAPLWRLLIHDWSKFTPAEWGPYVRTFYDKGRKRPGEFDKAWLHHQHRNPHHWQHWLLREDDGDLKTLRMPHGLVREMVADWMGAGRAITGKWDVATWYEANRHKIVLEPQVRQQVENLIANHARPLISDDSSTSEETR